MITLIWVFLAISLVCNGETRLLTGNSSDQLHSGGGTIMDVSADGNLVLFSSEVSEGPQSLPFSGLYVRNIEEGVLEYINIPAVTNTGISQAQMSDDGRYICWASIEDRHIYWMDRTTAELRWVTENHRTFESFIVNSTFPIMSSDGRYIAFASNSLSLESDSSKFPAPGYPAVHLYDRVARSFKIISLTAAGQQIPTIGTLSGGTDIANYGNFDMTPDARYVVFATDWSNSHPDRLNQMFAGYSAVLRREISSGATVLLNKNSVGNVANASFSYPRISADGKRVAFIGSSVGFYPPIPLFVPTKMISSYPANALDDLYLKEVSSQKVWLLTPTTAGSHLGTIATSYQLNSTGTVIAYASNAGNLIANSDAGGGSGQTNDVFRAVPKSNGFAQLTLITESPAGSGNVSLRNGPFMPANGDFIAFGTAQFAEMGYPGSSPIFHGIGVGTFPTPVISELTFEQWATALPEGKRGPNDNPSGDGIANLLKFFIGSDASITDLRFLPQQEFRSGEDLGFPGDTGKYMTLTVRIRRGLISWQVQSANSLDALVNTPGPTLPLGQPVADGDFDIHRFRSFTPIGQRGFMRLKVNLPE